MTPAFSPAFRDELRDLFRWRRDVRRFRPEALPREPVVAHEALLREALGLEPGPRG